MHLRPRKKRLCTCVWFSHFQFSFDVHIYTYIYIPVFFLLRQNSSLARLDGEGRGSGGSRISCAFFPIYGVKGLNAWPCDPLGQLALQENGNCPFGRNATTTTRSSSFSVFSWPSPRLTTDEHYLSYQYVYTIILYHCVLSP